MKLIFVTFRLRTSVAFVDVIYRRYLHVSQSARLFAEAARATEIREMKRTEVSGQVVAGVCVR